MTNGRKWLTEDSPQEPVRFGGVTKVNQNVSTPSGKGGIDGNMKDSKDTRGYDRNSRPNDHRPEKINFAPNPNPSTPTQRPPTPIENIKAMWEKDIERQTMRARKMQRPGKEPK
jgi:hypothetical protein